MFGDIDNLIVVHVQAGNSIIRFRLGRLLFGRDSAALMIKLHHTVSLRVAHIVAEHHRAAVKYAGITKKIVCTIKYVIAKYEGHRNTSDKLFSHQKRLRNSGRTLLNLVFEPESELRPVPKQRFKSRRVVGCGDNKNVPDTVQHEG